MNWYAIRSVYLFGTKEDGTNVFEERIVCFEAATVEEAFEKSDVERESYASAINIEMHPDQHSYTLDGDKLIDGYEVWSQLFESKDSLDTFFENRYTKYEYKVDLWQPDA